jgi:3-methyladenine DNA glycosylase AlkD
MTEKEKLVNILSELKKHSKTTNLEGMAKFGINTGKALGVNIPVLREIGKKHKNDHVLAALLWDTGIHEARILASLVDNPGLVTEKQTESWVKDFDSWDLCDQCCANLFEDLPFAYTKAEEWSSRKEEFVKRAGFVLMARLAVSDKKADDVKFEAFFKCMLKESSDERNFVKKAVNWALRQTGKRSMFLNKAAILVAQKMLKSGSSSAKWIANDAIRELTDLKILKHIKR